MGKVVKLEVVKSARSQSVEAAWDRYVEAMQRSQRTLKLADGIEAGHAYADFVRLFDGGNHGRR